MPKGMYQQNIGVAQLQWCSGRFS